MYKGVESMVGKKDETVTELKKAKFYLDKLIESESQEKGV
jgi:hypothetical protein